MLVGVEYVGLWGEAVFIVSGMEMVCRALLEGIGRVYLCTWIGAKMESSILLILLHLHVKTIQIKHIHEAFMLPPK